MTKRLFAIAFIYLCTTMAWLVLGSTIFRRTNASDGQLRGQVGSTLGNQPGTASPLSLHRAPRTRSNSVR